MSLLFTDDSVSAPQANVAAARARARFAAIWSALQGNAVPLFVCAALWALSHPYAGIIHDGRIYIGRVMADLDPAGIGHDMMFVHDGQFGFSLFPFLIHGLVAHLGPGAAARIVSGLGCLCSFAAATILAMQLIKGARSGSCWFSRAFSRTPTDRKFFKSQRQWQCRAPLPRRRSCFRSPP